MAIAATKTQTLKRFMRSAYDAASRSNDSHTHNGVVLVDMGKGKVVAGGCNLVPECLATDPDRFERPAKYIYTEHAERVAIYLCARLGVPTRGLWMFSTWAACTECARAIVLADIRHLVRHRVPEHIHRADWSESICRGDEILEEAGVEVINLESKLGLKNLFDGRFIDV